MAFRATRLPSLNQIPRRIEIAFLSSLRIPNPIQNPNNFLLLSPHRLTQSQGGIRASHSLRSHPLAAAMSGEASPSPSSESAKTVRVIVKGRVQGVFYRNWTIENAKELGLRGWVRNRRDGSVEALFSGKDDLVAEMERRCRHGPTAAIVTGIDVFPSSDDPGSGFDRKQTVWENDTSKQPNLKTHRNNENYNDLNTNIMM